MCRWFLEGHLTNDPKVGTHVVPSSTTDGGTWFAARPPRLHRLASIRTFPAWGSQRCVSCFTNDLVPEPADLSSPPTPSPVGRMVWSSRPRDSQGPAPPPPSTRGYSFGFSFWAVDRPRTFTRRAHRAVFRKIFKLCCAPAHKRYACQDGPPKSCSPTSVSCLCCPFDMQQARIRRTHMFTSCKLLKNDICQLKLQESATRQVPLPDPRAEIIGICWNGWFECEVSPAKDYVVL